MMQCGTMQERIYSLVNLLYFMFLLQMTERFFLLVCGAEESECWEEPWPLFPAQLLLCERNLLLLG